MLLYCFLIIFSTTALIQADDRAEVNIRVSGACSPSKNYYA